jgi:hypothetical protein
MWVHIDVCELMAMNLSSFSANAVSRPLICTEIMGSKLPLFASPSDLVCGLLHLAKQTIKHLTVPTLQDAPVSKIWQRRRCHSIQRIPRVPRSNQEVLTMEPKKRAVSDRSIGLQACGSILCFRVCQRLTIIPVDMLAPGKFGSFTSVRFEHDTVVETHKVLWISRFGRHAL